MSWPVTYSEVATLAQEVWRGSAPSHLQNSGLSCLYLPQTSFRSIDPRPRDWQASALSTKPLLRTKVCLPFLPYILPVGVGWTANLTLTATPISVGVDWKLLSIMEEPRRVNYVLIIWMFLVHLVMDWNLINLIERKKESKDKLLSGASNPGLETGKPVIWVSRLI